MEIAINKEARKLKLQNNRKIKIKIENEVNQNWEEKYLRIWIGEFFFVL